MFGGQPVECHWNNRLLDPHHISLSTKTCSPLRRESPTDYVSTIRIDVLYGEKREAIGHTTVYRVRMEQIINDNTWSLFDIFDSHSSDLGNIYEELFDGDEVIPALADELMDYGNIVLIKSILLLPEYRGQQLGGLLTLAIAELFDERVSWPQLPASGAAQLPVSGAGSGIPQSGDHGLRSPLRPVRHPHCHP